ncbi:class F sortase [Streptomyces orinoci]|uniref:Class F sortase n=1 Tax=Streptomyces orinoci TaxID=67339 RepID=A0ABV3JS19_STRON|nr:class F sortase [Streptomyces orinoci]
MAVLLARGALCLACAFGLALVPGVSSPEEAPGTFHRAHAHGLPREAETASQGGGDVLSPAPPEAVEIRGHFRATVVPVAADADGALELPRSPDTIGWWALGARPGAREGTVLLAGHVDTREYGPGVFAALRDVRPGTQVVITSDDGGTHSYLITEHHSYPKSTLPAGLFTDTGQARLALITCTGTYDRQRHRYTHNLVLIGRPLPDHA